MRRHLCFMAAIAALFTSGLHGQTTFATITGTVTDPSGAAVPGATVVATHIATNTQTTTQSNEAGIYTLSQLREGQYSVHAKSAGFKEYVAQNVELIARDYRRLDISMEVGAVETAVEVTAGATLIETETARISDTRDATQLRDMPLNSRAMWAQLSLAPNVLQAAAGVPIEGPG